MQVKSQNGGVRRTKYAARLGAGVSSDQRETFPVRIVFSRMQRRGWRLKAVNTGARVSVRSGVSMGE